MHSRTPTPTPSRLFPRGRSPALRATVAVVLTVLVAACITPPEESPTAPPPIEPGRPGGDTDGDETASLRGGTIRIAATEPESIVPGDADGPSAPLVLGALYEPLTRLDADGEVQPGAADAWASPDGGLTWVITIRSDSRFHDGTAVTPDDVAWSWTRTVADGLNGFLLREVDGWDALRRGETGRLRGVTIRPADDEGPERIEVVLREPNTLFPVVLSHPALAPVSRAQVENEPDSWTGQPIGNGPFMAAEPRSPGSFLRLTRAETWVGADGSRPELDEVLITFSDVADGFVALTQERVDVAPVPDGALDTARATYGRSPDGIAGPGVIDGAVPRMYLLGFNTRQPPFDNPAVRRAISQAIDRDALAEIEDGTEFDPALGLIPPVLPHARSEPCETCTRDVNAARRAFREAGVDRVVLWFNLDPGHRRVADRIREDLAAVGVRVVFRTPDFDEFLAAVETGDAGMFRWGWSAEHPLADDVLHPLLHSSRRDGNLAGIEDVRLDRWLSAARAARVPEARSLYITLIENRALELQLYVPLFTYRHVVAVSDRVDGYAIDPFGRVDLTTVRLRS